MTTTEDKKAAVVAEDKTKPEKSKTALEEDDEFEDFPADEGESFKLHGCDGGANGRQYRYTM